MLAGVSLSNQEFGLSPTCFASSFRTSSISIPRTPSINCSWYQEVHDFGLNYRLTDFQCALGIAQLKKIDEYKRRRRIVHESYMEILSHLPNVRTLKSLEGRDPMWHLFPIFVKNRDYVLSALRDEGIMSQINYIPSYFHPVFQKMRYERGICPNSEQFYQEEISLPLHVSMSQETVKEICRILESIIS